MELSALDDVALVARTRDGQRDAFSTLVLRYQERVMNLVYRRLGDRDAALDVAQEVFIKAYRGLDRFQGEARFFTWLFRIALNEAATAHRKRARHDRAVSLDRETSRGERAPEPRDGGEEPAAGLERADEVALVQRAIEDLDEELAAPLVLRDIDGLPYQDIAAVLGIPLGSVKSRIHRARLALRTRLAPAVPAAPGEGRAA